VQFRSSTAISADRPEIESERELLQRLADGERRLVAICERHQPIIFRFNGAIRSGKPKR
jgi:hypothetical protein